MTEMEIRKIKGILEKVGFSCTIVTGEFTQGNKKGQSYNDLECNKVLKPGTRNVTLVVQFDQQGKDILQSELWR